MAYVFYGEFKIAQSLKVSTTLYGHVLYMYVSKSKFQH